MEAQAIPTLLREDVNDLCSDARLVAGDLKTILDDTAGLADENFAELRKTAEQRIRRTMARLMDAEERLEAQLERAVHRSERLVARHPVEAVAAASLAAGAIGAAIWLLWRGVLIRD